MSGLFTHRNFSLQDTPPLDGKVAVVTGGQAGIGKEITAQLLLHGIEKVFVIARGKDKYSTAHEEWRHREGISLDENDRRVEFIQCDLADVKSVKEAADQIKRSTSRLDILICNAGMGLASQYKRSPQNVDLVFATNCVSHQVLVTLLLPLMKQSITQGKTTDARIVVTSSSMHSLCRSLNLGQLATPDRPKPAFIDGIWRYARSKLGNILFTRELARRLELEGDAASTNIYVNVFFPGNIVTDQWNVWNDYFGKVVGSFIRYIFSIIGQTVEDGAATAVYLATSRDIRDKHVRGQYFVPVAKPYATTNIACDMRLARDLWDWIDAKTTETLGPNWQHEARST